MGFIFAILGSLANYVRQFGKPGITAGYIFGLISLSLLATDIFPKGLFSLEERIFYFVIGVVGATYAFIRTILSMEKVKPELFAHYPMTSLAVVKSSAENIEALYIGSEKGMKSVVPWSSIYPQYVALLQSDVFFDPAVQRQRTVSPRKVLGVHYKNGLFQFVPLSILETYDAVQFARACEEAGTKVDWENESVKNTQHHLTDGNSSFLIKIVAVGAILYVLGLIFLWMTK